MEPVDQQFAFHRLARSWPAYHWWKPLVTGLLGVAIYLVLTVILIVISVVLALATSADPEQYLDAAAAIDLSDPVIFAFTLVSLILLIPSLVLATLIIGPKPIGLLSSVTGRLRWRWLGLCTLVALGIYAVSLLVSTAIGALFPTDAAPIPQPDTSTMVILLALTLLAVPFQAAAEEYVFRGYLMQLVGSWLKHPVFAILLPVPLFVLGHLYDPLGQVDIAIFAIFAGWITWRTGGLEAAIAIHAINNMTIFALGALGLVDVNASEGSVGGLVVSVLTMGITAFVIVRLANRRGIERTRTVTPPPVPPAFGGAPGMIPFPAGDGVWHQSAPQPHPRADRQLVPGADAGTPQRYDSSHDPFRYDASQYDPARYGSVPEAPSRETPARQEHARSDAGGTDPRGGSHAMPRDLPRAAPEAVRDAAPGTSPEDGSGYASGSPARSPFARPDGTVESGAPARVEAGNGFGGRRHPSGPVFPPGPGYPAGTPFPAGPGFPAAGASARDTPAGSAAGTADTFGASRADDDAQRITQRDEHGDGNGPAS